MRHKVTQKHFEEFRRHVLLWVERFGLTDWKVIIKQRTLKDEHLASCHANNDARSVIFEINTTFHSDVNPTSDEIRKTAIHEVSHLFLSDLYDLGRCRFATRLEWDRAEECATVRLQNMISRYAKE